LHLKGAFVDATVHNSIKARAALVEQGRRSKVRIACINSRAAGQQSMRECRTAVILQQTQLRIDIDLVARAVQIPPGIIAAEIVAMGRHSAASIEKSSAHRAAVQDGIAGIHGGATKVGTGDPPPQSYGAAGANRRE